MNKDVNLSQFDYDAVIMIKQLTGVMPEVKRNDEMTFYVLWDFERKSEEFTDVHDAILEALKGRFGKRYNTNTLLNVDAKDGVIYSKNKTFFIYDSQEWPIENVFEVEPNVNVGILFTPKLRQFRAIQLTPENINKVADFTGGGNLVNYTNTNTPENTYYEFETENGTFIKVLPGDFIACENDHYFMISQKDMDNYFEPKYSN